MSRRRFLGGLVAASAIGTAALGAPRVQTLDRRARQKQQWDLIVLGAGTAGMPAAIFAAQAGARVLVIEATAVTGGTLDRSTGQLSASGTVWQRARGIEDSPDAHYADHMRINNWSSDPALTRLFVDEAPETLNWLAASGFQIVEGDPVKGKGHDPFTVARYQNGPERGRSILKAMQPLFDAAVASGRVVVKFETEAAELIQDGSGAVVGVLTESGGRQREEHFGARVLIATGGCAANPSLFQDLHGTALTTLSARPSSKGHGLLLAQAAGGYLRGGEKYVPLYGGLLESDTAPSMLDASFRHDPGSRPPWEIHVNARGERFVQEDNPGHEYREHALARQPGHRLWVVGDSEILQKAPPFVTRWSAEKVMKAFDDAHPMFSRADTLSTLAMRAGIDPGGLFRSIAQYNAALVAGTPDPFGRTHRPLPIAKPPFFAVRMTGWTVFSFAGIAVDTSLRVLRHDGAAVPNLYAAGEAIGGAATSGNAYTNGSVLTPALAFGRLAGRRAMTR